MDICVFGSSCSPCADLKSLYFRPGLQLPITICSVKATDAAFEAVAAFPFKAVGIAATESLLCPGTLVSNRCGSVIDSFFVPVKINPLMAFYFAFSRL